MHRFYQLTVAAMLNTNNTSFTSSLLAGLVALLRGLYDKDGIVKVLLDAVLCSIFGLFAQYIPCFHDAFINEPHRAFVACVVIGSVGSHYIIVLIKTWLDAVNPSKIIKR
ncbi:phage holin family protein [Hafnia alvei]|uniref:phage holin family protein n=1 Tax=Hafnia alvei TaxID=569 RepID=UPI000C9F3944|nr:phage holin family protein [Hafnia alvei]MBI0275453.1 phage holin family protein [Hafnia alvei]PNK98551.1 hypothetical protein CEQ28_013635 [Hafnia alvei]